MDMFADLIGIKDIKKLNVENKFLKDNRLIINYTNTTSRYQARGSEYDKIGKIIDKILKNSDFNSIFFFPSYAFMDKVYELINERSKIIKENPNLTREEKKGIISKLQNENVSLFAVIGGNFSESIGVKGNKIKLVVVVGVPFEPPSIKLKAMEMYYDKKFGKGFEYAQILNAMIKTMQAAGRTIRSDKDRGVILLMDVRFSYGIFKKYLPQEVITTNEDPTPLILNFIYRT